MEISKEFNKIFEFLSQYYDRYSVFYDLMKMCAISIYNVFARNEQLEKDYISTIQKYKKEHQNMFSELFAEIVKVLEKKQRLGEIVDILGPFYSFYNLFNKKLGQCFTPEHVSKLMAEISINEQDLNSVIEKDGFITMNEPTCGSGRYGFIICRNSI